ncbi:GNAT family N-acetyltransferase [Colwellia hornerae]|uniref:GNAT family N-acetyltransferase n=1 Tax=Colwellia hornerae TaxID=89402 RepID=A0A5C6QM33_9GAMM|nr:GNAT family N-acetyltransferase [Colwellia hornerae]TWX53619.1 GNAT family N-acetyltransferase [Colwellia hornerae]TWX60270.1 GNAT family N-acetyltransferase [Colwellia hornerae]TWX70025.1 GNAT family N-acetyltransferase [Colwellia hornerae]
MSIKFSPLTKYDVNYSNVIELYKEAFTTVRRVPSCLLRFMLRKGKDGFSVLYESDNWIGLIYLTEYKDIVFVHFFAIAEFQRSSGYGSKVLDALKDKYESRIVLNIEELQRQQQNYSQRVKRKAFYLNNGFISSGFIVKEPEERLEMLIHGGNISKEEIDAVYKNLFGGILGSLYRPKIITINN